MQQSKDRQALDMLSRHSRCCEHRGPRQTQRREDTQREDKQALGLLSVIGAVASIAIHGLLFCSEV
eukprot:1158623-Pelagomonas_calceolata.AAC.6